MVMVSVSNTSIYKHIIDCEICLKSLKVGASLGQTLIKIKHDKKKWMAKFVQR